MGNAWHKLAPPVIPIIVFRRRWRALVAAAIVVGCGGSPEDSVGASTTGNGGSAGAMTGGAAGSSSAGWAGAGGIATDASPVGVAGNGQVWTSCDSCSVNEYCFVWAGATLGSCRRFSESCDGAMPTCECACPGIEIGHVCGGGTSYCTCTVTDGVITISCSGA